MAQVAITKIVDGPRTSVFHVFFSGDGSGELNDEVLIDPTTSFDPALGADPIIRIDKLWYDLTGFTAKLEFDYLTSDTPVWSMSDGQANHMDFCGFGGLKDRSNELDASGKLKITTSGLGLGDVGSLVIKMRKS